MILPRNPEKKVQSIIKKIEKGRATEANIILLMDMLNKEPSIIPDVVGSLTAIMQKDDKKAFKSAIWVLNVVADKDIGVVSESLDVIVSCIQKDLHSDDMLNTIEILFKINQEHPDLMNIAVPELLLCLQNMNETVREKTYSLLEPVAEMHPEFFRGHSKELIRVLNGLNVDERIYASRLIGKIAEKDPAVVEDTYDILKYLRINHLSRELRLEAASAIDKFKIEEEVAPEGKERMIEQEGVREASGMDVMQDKLSCWKPEVSSMAEGKEKQGSPGQPDVNEEMPVKKGSGIGEEEIKLIETALQKTISSRVIKSAMIVDTEGNVLALSGQPVDSSLLSNLSGMFSFENNEEFRSRISLEHADKKIVAVRFGVKAILVAVTDANTPIGMVLHELNKSVEKISKLVNF